MQARLSRPGHRSSLVASVGGREATEGRRPWRPAAADGPRSAFGTRKRSAWRVRAAARRMLAGAQFPQQTSANAVAAFAYPDDPAHRRSRNSLARASGRESASDMRVTTGELIRRLVKDGWYQVRQSGSHAIYRHPTKKAQLTVPVHPGKEVPRGTAARLLKVAEIE